MKLSDYITGGTYKIVRFYQENRKPKIIKRGLTLAQAKEHCNNPDTNSSTCTNEQGLKHTAKYGQWFDGLEKE